MDKGYANVQAVPGVDVRLIAEPIDHTGSPTTAVAVPGAGVNMLLFHANLELSGPGRWRVTIRTAGPAGKGHATFEVQVEPPVWFRWPLIGVIGGVSLVWFICRWLFPGQGVSGRDTASHP